MTRCILDRLTPESGKVDWAADVGCGTGLFTRGLAERAHRVVCVDPSPRMLEQLPDGNAYFPVTASAEDVVAGRVALPYDRFDAILVKEAIHHVEDRAVVVEALARLLAEGGRLLVVMLPTQIDYPLFTEALELFERLQPNPDDIAAAMRQAGLKTELTYETFPLSFSRDRYLGMVRARYMSLLSMFDDAAVERGILEIENRYREDRLEFGDRFAFITGVRG